MKTLLELTMAIIVLLCMSTVIAFADDSATHGRWRFAGANIQNTAAADHESEISSANVSQLVPLWIYKTAPDGACNPHMPPPSNGCGDITAAPAILGHILYVPDWSGNLSAVDIRTGIAIWKKNLADYSNDPKMHGLKVILSRTTPAIVGNLLIVGSNTSILNSHEASALNNSGAVELAINRQTGDLVWATQLDNQPTAVVTQSAVAKGNMIYVGVSSFESGSVAYGLGSSHGPVTVPGTNDIYQCCSFRGSMIALDKTDGHIVWRFYTVPITVAEQDWRNRPTGPTLSFSGNSVWGSTPVIDLKRNSLYFGTGQTHTMPLAVAQANNLVFPYVGSPTIPAGDYPSSILALDLTTGKLKWAKSFGKLNGMDAWNASCISFLAAVIPGLPTDANTLPYCPANIQLFGSPIPPLANLTLLNDPFDFYWGVFLTAYLTTGTGASDPSLVPPNGPLPPLPYPWGPFSWDNDFAQGPMLVNNVKMPNGSTQDLLIAAQKSGVTRAINPDNGAVIWATWEGPGGTEGGHEWGSATDGMRIYLTNNNILNTPIILHDVNGNSSVTVGSYWSALDIATGKILWETAEPFGGGSIHPFFRIPVPASMSGAVSVANGVVFGGTRDYDGSFYALDAATGQIKFSFATGNNAAGNPSSINSRATIANGVVYFGAGYTSDQATASPGGSNKLYAFALPDHKYNAAADDSTDDDNNDGDKNGNN